MLSLYKRGDELSIITALENMATENNIDQTINITLLKINLQTKMLWLNIIKSLCK